MAKNTVEDWDSDPDGNTDVGGVSIAEGCPPGNVNNGMRMIMAQVKTYSEEVTDGLESKATTVDLNAAVAALTASLTPAPASIEYFMRKTAPATYVKANGGTIGNAASGATTRANADTVNLFTVLWNEFTNAELPIQTSTGAASTRGVSAAADYAANKRLTIFDLRTRFVRGADDGLGFDASLTVGTSQADGIKLHTHTTQPHDHPIRRSTTSGDPDNVGVQTGPRVTSTVLTNETTVVVNDNTGGLALETRPRAFAALACVKL